MKISKAISAVSNTANSSVAAGNIYEYITFTDILYKASEVFQECLALIKYHPFYFSHGAFSATSVPVIPYLHELYDRASGRFAPQFTYAKDAIGLELFAISGCICGVMFDSITGAEYSYLSVLSVEELGHISGFVMAGIVIAAHEICLRVLPGLLYVINPTYNPLVGGVFN